VARLKPCPPHGDVSEILGMDKALALPQWCQRDFRYGLKPCPRCFLRSFILLQTGSMDIFCDSAQDRDQNTGAGKFFSELASSRAMDLPDARS